ncbi:proline-rich coiled-coil 2C [Xylographa opegraphella]|nr:proline-rich coiled-coil 2C [Xylographa opegraphella]
MRLLHGEIVLLAVPALSIALGQRPNLPGFPSLPAVSIAPTTPTLTAVGGTFPSSLPPTTGGVSVFPSAGPPTGPLGNSTLAAPTQSIRTPSAPIMTASFLTVTTSMPSLPAPVPTSTLVPTSSSNPLIPDMSLPPIIDPTALLAAILASLRLLDYSVNDLLALLSPLALIPAPPAPASDATVTRYSTIVATVTTSVPLGSGIPAPTGGVVALPAINVAGASTEDQQTEAGIEKKVMAALAALS